MTIRVGSQSTPRLLKSDDSGPTRGTFVKSESSSTALLAMLGVRRVRPS
jgi:hypothetical protein